MKKKKNRSHIREELKEIDFKYIPFCRVKRMGKTRSGEGIIIHTHNEEYMRWRPGLSC